MDTNTGWNPVALTNKGTGEGAKGSWAVHITVLLNVYASHCAHNIVYNLAGHNQGFGINNENGPYLGPRSQDKELNLFRWMLLFCQDIQKLRGIAL
jgi:hypothetical protein